MVYTNADFATLAREYDMINISFRRIVLYLELSEEQHSYLASRNRMTLFCAESRLNPMPPVSDTNKCDSLINHSKISKSTFFTKREKIDKFIIIKHDRM